MTTGTAKCRVAQVFRTWDLDYLSHLRAHVLDTPRESRAQVQEGLGPPGRRSADEGVGTSASESVLDQRGASPLQACALRPVTEGNGVAVRRGREQPEVNHRSVG